MKPTIRDDGYLKNLIWEHSSTVHELYRRRCLLQEEEMTVSRQAARLLACHAADGDSVLDAGCGSGYFFHSLQRQNVKLEYHGLDASPTLIEIGRECMPRFGLPKEHLHVLRIEDFDGEFDHCVCLSVLSNIDNYHRPLERLLKSARKTVVLRESCAERPSTQYVRDKYLDPGVELNVYVNTYALTEFTNFIRSYGFSVEEHVDERTAGEPEIIIDYPHYWRFFVARRMV